MGTPSYTAITVERRGAADWVTLSRPDRLNALNHAMAGDLYPHIDASFGVVRELKERLAPLPDDARRKVLGGNAPRFYKLGG